MRFLLVDPHADIWAHSRVMLQIALSLLKQGHSVLSINCDKALRGHCTVDESHKIGPSVDGTGQPRSCSSCTSTAHASDRLLATFPKFSSVSVSALVPRGEEIALLRDQRAATFLDLIEPRSGCPVGKLALYETFLRFKLSSSLELSPEASRYQKIYALNAYRMAGAGVELAERHEFDAVISYSPQYSSVGSFCWAFEQKSIPVYFVEGSSGISQRFSHFRFWNWTKFGLDGDKRQVFEFIPRNENISSKTVEHFSLIENGASYAVYSPRPSKKLRRANASDSDTRRVALLSMSSSDEVLAAQVIGRMNSKRASSAVFEDQIDWLRKTVEWFRQNPNCLLIVRPHPRDFPTAREPAEAHHTLRLRETLSNLPGNVMVDWPSNPKPLWDYFGNIRLFITGWSSTAMEAVFNDVPVLCYDEQLIGFPKEIVTTCRSSVEYFDLLDAAMKTHLPVLQSQKTALSQWVDFNYYDSDIAGVPRIFERFRKKSRPLDRVLNGLDFFLPAVTRFVDRQRIMRHSIRLDSLATQLEQRISKPR